MYSYVLNACVCAHSLLLALDDYHGIVVNYVNSKDKAEDVVRTIEVGEQWSITGFVHSIVFDNLYLPTTGHNRS